MTSKLKDIAMIAGFSNMKELAKKSNIPYSTLLRYSKTSIDSWKPENTSKIAKTLNLSASSLQDRMSEPVLLPFIKWVGGKRQLLPELIKYAPKNFNTYFEPFIGGGAFLFKLAPKKAVINDFNSELTNTWQVIRDKPQELIKLLKVLETKNNQEDYYKIRAVDRTGEILKMTDVQRAGRFIYINKAGFNGLYRTNKNGWLNTPWNHSKKLNLTPDFLLDDSNYLRSNDISIRNEDFKDAVKDAVSNDFCYFDPPYIPLDSASNPSFTSYTKEGFGLIQQQQLAEVAKKLVNRGVKVMLSNSDVPLIKELYGSKAFTIHKVKASRMINSDGKKRGKINEVIITSNNY